MASALWLKGSSVQAVQAYTKYSWTGCLTRAACVYIDAHLLEWGSKCVPGCSSAKP